MDAAGPGEPVPLLRRARHQAFMAEPVHLMVSKLPVSAHPGRPQPGRRSEGAVLGSLRIDVLRWLYFAFLADP